MYFGQVVGSEAHGYRIKQVGVIREVDQSFGGLFTPTTPPPSPVPRRCVAGNPPPWATTSPVTR